MDNIRESLLNVAVAVVAILLASVPGPGSAAYGGMVYWTVGPLMFVHAVWSGRRRKRLGDRLELG